MLVVLKGFFAEHKTAQEYSRIGNIIEFTHNLLVGISYVCTLFFYSKVFSAKLLNVVFKHESVQVSYG